MGSKVEGCAAESQDFDVAGQLQYGQLATLSTHPVQCILVSKGCERLCRLQECIVCNCTKFIVCKLCHRRYRHEKQA